MMVIVLARRERRKVRRRYLPAAKSMVEIWTMWRVWLARQKAGGLREGGRRAIETHDR